MTEPFHWKITQISLDVIRDEIKRKQKHFSSGQKTYMVGKDLSPVDYKFFFSWQDEATHCCYEIICLSGSLLIKIYPLPFKMKMQMLKAYVNGWETFTLNLWCHPVRVRGGSLSWQTEMTTNFNGTQNNLLQDHYHRCQGTSSFLDLT
jgi:hypothetical protein